MAQKRGEPGAGWGRPDSGVDAGPEARPGVPMYARGIRPLHEHARPGQPTTLARQQDDSRHLKRLGLKRLTPVYGTANPPHGLSGVMRRWAYGFPEDLARHWMILLAADRVDVLEAGLGGVLERPLVSAGFPGLGRRVRRNPFGALALAAGGLWLTGTLLARSRK